MCNLILLGVFVGELLRSLNESAEDGQGQEDCRRGENEAILQERGQSGPRLEDLLSRALFQIKVEKLENRNFDVGRNSTSEIWWRLQNLSNGLHEGCNRQQLHGRDNVDDGHLLVVT